MTILVLLLVIGVCYVIHHLLTSPSGQDDQRSSEPRRSNRSMRSPRPASPGEGDATGPTGWTALDDHQLNRLLDEFSP